jgi:amidophosphoribosyltransferase
MMENLGEKCGVFGVFGKGLDVSRLTFFGLYALQHRGQESSGIATSDGRKIFCYKNTGLVSQVFNEKIIESLPGHISIGHNRYSTSSGTGLEHAQPIEVADGTLTLAHNGNLPSVKKLTEFLLSKKIKKESCSAKATQDRKISGMSDSTLMTEALHALTSERMEIEEAIREIFPLFTGAFSLLIMTKKKLIALRDAHGIRPLSLAKLNGGFVFSSETCAFHPIGAEFIRAVKPGEMVVVDERGLRSVQIAPGEQKLDIFEFVYFSRPDSILLGQSVYDVRKKFGEALARENKIKADVVIPVPETAIPVAIGFANAAKIPFEMGLIKSRYIHRTFIEPEQHIREQGVKLKLSPLAEVIKGKRVVVIDDSIVRGTTSRQIVKAIFETGAKEVHFLVSSPPVKFPDFYGIDLPDQKKLLAHGKSIAEMKKYLGATSLRFLSYKGMIAATGLPESSFSTSCFTGRYPIDIEERKGEVKY